MHISALQDLVATSHKFSQLAKRAQQAHRDGDEAALTMCSLFARQTRHDYNAAKAAAGDKPPPIQNLAEVMGAIKTSMMEAYSGEKLMTEWQEREIDRSKLPTTQEEALAWVDVTLPVVWNYREDVIIFLGNGMEPIRERLLLLGQQRIIDGDADDAEKIYRTLREFKPRQPLNAYVYSAIGKIPDAIAARISDAMRDNKVFGNTVNAFAEKWVAQGIPNMRYIQKLSPVYQLGGAFAGRPFILVAPGPSLDKNIFLLQRAQDKAVICTVSHALKICQANGIRVDFCLTVDSNQLAYHFDGCDTLHVGALVTGLTCDPKLFELPARNHLYMGANAAADAWMLDGVDDFAILPAGGSVATTAIAMAVNLRCNPIIAVGLDCALADTGKMYAKNSHDEEVAGEVVDGKLMLGGWSKQAGDMMGKEDYHKPEPHDLITLPGYYGGTVNTTMILRMFHSWFTAIARSAGHNHKFLNCTEGGANIETWENMPLDEALKNFVDDLQPIPIWRGIDFMVARDNKVVRKALATNRIGTMSRAVKKIILYAGKAVAALDAGNVDELQKYETDLLRKLKLAPVVSLLMQIPLHAALDRSYSAETPHDVKLAEKEFLLTVRKAAEYVRDTIAKSRL